MFKKRKGQSKTFCLAKKRELPGLNRYQKVFEVPATSANTILQIGSNQSMIDVEQ